MASNLVDVAEKENLGPPKSKCGRLSLKLEKKAAPQERFPVLPKDQVEDTKRPIVAKNTSKSTQWALRCFEAWLRQRNERCEGKCPKDILLSENHHDLWLCICVNELRKEDGEACSATSANEKMLLFGCLIQTILFLSHCTGRSKTAITNYSRRVWERNARWQKLLLATKRSDFGRLACYQVTHLMVFWPLYFINPRCACAATVTVVVLCVCLCVCLRLFSHYRLRGGL